MDKYVRSMFLCRFDSNNRHTWDLRLKSHWLCSRYSNPSHSVWASALGKTYDCCCAGYESWLRRNRKKLAISLPRAACSY